MTSKDKTLCKSLWQSQSTEQMLKWVTTQRWARSQLKTFSMDRESVSASDLLYATPLFLKDVVDQFPEGRCLTQFATTLSFWQIDAAVHLKTLVCLCCPDLPAFRLTPGVRAHSVTREILWPDLEFHIAQHKCCLADSALIAEQIEFKPDRETHFESIKWWWPVEFAFEQLPVNVWSTIRLFSMLDPVAH